MRPDPAAKEATRAARKTARVKAWKREKTPKARKDAQTDRIAEWEKATGQTWPI